MSITSKSIFLEETYDELDSFTPIKDRMDKTIPHSNGDDENDCKFKKRVEKRDQSNNLEAERKRRKKLNDRLYSLRALVPNITKLDRGAILGDAIHHIKELQRQVKDLQTELEQDSDNDEDTMTIVQNRTDHNWMKNGSPKRENGSFLIDFDNEPFGNGGVNVLGQNNEVENEARQMEPQVKVIQIDGSELFVKVFCEHKLGGFVRILEAMNSMGFQVNNVNATRHRCLVSNIFRAEKRDCETFQADHIRESLLDLERNP